jgi:hypothetical protein
MKTTAGREPHELGLSVIHLQPIEPQPCGYIDGTVGDLRQKQIGARWPAGAVYLDVVGIQMWRKTDSLNECDQICRVQDE